MVEVSKCQITSESYYLNLNTVSCTSKSLSFILENRKLRLAQLLRLDSRKLKWHTDSPKIRPDSGLIADARHVVYRHDQTRMGLVNLSCNKRMSPSKLLRNFYNRNGPNGELDKESLFLCLSEYVIKYELRNGKLQFVFGATLALPNLLIKSISCRVLSSRYCQIQQTQSIAELFATRSAALPGFHW